MERLRRIEDEEFKKKRRGERKRKKVSRKRAGEERWGGEGEE